MTGPLKKSLPTSAFPSTVKLPNLSTVEILTVALPLCARVLFCSSPVVGRLGGYIDV